MSLLTLEFGEAIYCLFQTTKYVKKRNRTLFNVNACVRFKEQAPHEDPAIPEVIRDKIEFANDPEAYREKLIRKNFNKRTLITSPSAVLKPVPKKPKR